MTMMWNEWRGLLTAGFLLLAGGALCAGAPTPGAQPPTGPRLLLWVKAEELAGRYQNGARLDVWPDASGNGHDLKATGEQRPVLKAVLAAAPELAPDARALDKDLDPDVQKRPDRWAVGFSGNGSFFSLPLAGEWRGVTIFAAGKRLARPGLFETAPGHNGCLRQWGFMQSCGNTPGINNPFPAIRESPGTDVVCVAAGVDAAGVFTLATRANGAPQERATDAAPLYGVIFRTPRLGCDKPGFTGEVAEFLLYQGVLSEAQIQATERYLMVKHGLAVAAEGPPPAPALAPGPATAETTKPLPPVTGTPAKSGLRLWLRADDAPDPRRGALVASLPDRSPAKTPVTAPAAWQPSFEPAALAGRPALKFGSEPRGQEQARAFDLGLAGEWPELTLVAAGTDVGGVGFFDTAPARNGTFRTLSFAQLAGSKLALDTSLPLAQRGALQVVTYTIRADGTGGRELASFWNGLPQANRAAELCIPILMRNPRIGTVNGGEANFQGLLGEVLLYDRALTDAERRQTEAYLAERYAVRFRTLEEVQRERSQTRWSRLPHIPAKTSWLGNTFSGKDAWVQSGISGITVLPDGTVAATSIWDERHKELGFYKDGQPVGPVIHGGASGITCDETFFYVGHSGMGKPTAGVRRYQRDGSFAGTEAPWPELGAAKWIRFETAKPWQEVRGVALLGTELFVTAAGAAEIRVYDKTTGALTRTVPVTGAGPIAAAPDGTLWVGCAEGVVQLAADGRATGRKIAGIAAGALAVDPQGALLVGAGAPRHQIVRYALGGAEPVEMGVIGVRGGVYAGPRPGLLGDDRLWNIMGVGADAAGNVYAQCNGQLMRAYSPEGALRWQLECSVFCVAADFDSAADGADLMGKLNRYRHRPGAPPGRDWQWQAVTADGARFPELAGGLGPCVAVRRLNNGRLYRYTWVDALAVHIQEPESELFAPCALYVREKGITQRPAHAPADGRFVWTDRNGNGRIESAECAPPPAAAQKGRESFSFFVDDAGGIWEPQDRWGVRHLPLQGFAASSAPIYDLAAEVWYPKPREFISVLRAWYFPATDTMYLSGYTWDHPATGKEYVWGCCGRELIRYDDWTKPTRALRCRMPFPEDSFDVKSAAIAHEAGRAFAVDKENVIFVYDTANGAFLGCIEPDKSLVGQVGWMDIDSGLNVWRQRDGTLVLAAEESWSQRILLYRIGPGQRPASMPPPGK
jgi:hypothetical protein